MVPKVTAVKLMLSSLSLLSLSLFLIILLTSTYHPALRWSFIGERRDRSLLTKRSRPLDLVAKGIDIGLVKIEEEKEMRDGSSVMKRSGPLDFIAKEFGGKEIEIGLINIEEKEEEVRDWQSLGRTSIIRFDRPREGLRWAELFPEWIDEDERTKVPKCPKIPMPDFENYGEFDVVVARVPCGSEEKRGSRDVFRLQVHLVVGNLVMRNGRRRDDGTVIVVFIGACGPMWEIFRCEDLVKHEGNLWVYKPDLRRLKQKLDLPVGSCQLPVPLVKLDQGRITYNFSKLDNPLDHPKEAYVTVLHSSEDYVCGAIALAQSIIQTNSTKDLILLADKSITMKSRRALEMAGWKIKQIERIRSHYAAENAYNKWNYSKLRIWQLKDYDKIIFIDSDFIVLENLDRLFVLPQLSAVRNDEMIFNSGIMVVEPSVCTFKMLMDKRKKLFSSNGGDQGFINEVFTWWHRLPTRFNVLKYFKQTSRDGDLRELPEAYAIHFVGAKPWRCYRDYDCNWEKQDSLCFASDSAHQKWWKVHDSMPKRLHQFCGLSRDTDMRLKSWRENARLANISNGHWKVGVKDPRQFQL
ncbi:putative UDP-glucuronate:xylan alpha-glucuronosyltransferase 5 [Tasmannia lanceolata]|uniref:putative UDP-glucuronate:xylan alpha-glucuronosyltransferase 5 n=1 Tax=Tasmannia lanceolata TaxID=3420 RepID=UPI00406465F9